MQRRGPSCLTWCQLCLTIQRIKRFMLARRSAVLEHRQRLTLGTYRRPRSKISSFLIAHPPRSPLSHLGGIATARPLSLSETGRNSDQLSVQIGDVTFSSRQISFDIHFFCSAFSPLFVGEARGWREHVLRLNEKKM